MRATYHIQRRRNNQEAKTSVSGNNPAEKKIVRNFLAKNKQANDTQILRSVCFAKIQIEQEVEPRNL